jgi:cytochrome c553
MRSLTSSGDPDLLSPICRRRLPTEQGTESQPMKPSTWRCTPMILVALLTSLSAGGAQAQAAAKPDPAKGQQIVNQVCAGCHSADGNSVIPGNPKLAGQAAAYLVKQLTDLAKPPADASGRENPVMGAFAMTLSETDRQNVAAYFAAQTFKPGVARGKEALELGQRLYRAGNSDKAVPACAGCHGPAGDGLPVRFPRIGGQHGDYIEAQLKAFRDGTRRNNIAMEQIAFRLSDTEIKALADFVSGLQAR